MEFSVETYPTLRHACKTIVYGTCQSKSMKAARNYLLKAAKHNGHAYGYKPVILSDGTALLIKVTV